MLCGPQSVSQSLCTLLSLVSHSVSCASVILSAGQISSCKVSQSVICSISQYLGTASCSFNQSFSQLYNQSFHQPVSQLQADKEGLYYHLPVMHCRQPILSTAESQRVTHLKESKHGKHKGTRETHKIIQYTPHKLYQSHSYIATDAPLRSKILFTI